MNSIEEILQTCSKQNIEIPQKIQYRIRYTLKNKNKNKKYYFIKKLITAVASLIVVSIGSIGTYAVCGGKISGKPVIEMLGIKFSDEYENYKVPVKNQEISNNETSISLTETVCDEGFTILEFDIKLGKEDREKINDSIYVSFNNKFVTDETGTYLNALNNYSIIIDGEEKWIRPRSAQTATKISDYEYKIYQMYFLTDKELENKKDFTITLTDVVITSESDQTENGEIYLPMNGKFEVHVSKEKSLENTQIIKPETEEIEHKNMTKKIEKIINTPLQTILKVSSLYEDVSLEKLSNTKRNDYIDTIIYEAQNENGKRLSVCSYETKRLITYSNGTTEEWEQGDIGTSEKFNHAKMELTEYIIIEKNEGSSKIEITAKELPNKIFGKFNIDLNNK